MNLLSSLIFQKYSFSNIAELAELPGKFIIGAGAGPCHHVGVNSELICNYNMATDDNKSKIVRVNEEVSDIISEAKVVDKRVLI